MPQSIFSYTFPHKPEISEKPEFFPAFSKKILDLSNYPILGQKICQPAGSFPNMANKLKFIVKNISGWMFARFYPYELLIFFAVRIDRMEKWDFFGQAKESL
jgi:hypothetical protein